MSHETEKVSDERLKKLAEPFTRSIAVFPCDDDEQMSICRELLALRSEVAEARWVPISEQLPDSEVRVLVQRPDGTYDVDWIDRGEWYDEVLLWKPISAPTKGAPDA